MQSESRKACMLRDFDCTSCYRRVPKLPASMAGDSRSSRIARKVLDSNEKYGILLSYGRLAQRLAQVLYTHKVGGSNPSSPTIDISGPSNGTFFVESSPACCRLHDSFV